MIHWGPHWWGRSSLKDRKASQVMNFFSSNEEDYHQNLPKKDTLTLLVNIVFWRFFEDILTKFYSSRVWVYSECCRSKIIKKCNHSERTLRKKDFAWWNSGVMWMLGHFSLPSVQNETCPSVRYPTKSLQVSRKAPRTTENAKFWVHYWYPFSQKRYTKIYDVKFCMQNWPVPLTTLKVQFGFRCLAYWKKWRNKLSEN